MITYNNFLYWYEVERYWILRLQQTLHKNLINKHWKKESNKMLNFNKLLNSRYLKEYSLDLIEYVAQ